MDSMYEILMSLPLLNGVSRARILEIVGKTKFHFLKYLDGEQIAKAGEPCTHIKFVLSGAVRSTITNGDRRFRVLQTLNAPSVIAPEFLFGRSPYNPSDVVAVGATGILQIAKTDYLTMLTSDEIFMFNYLNMLSSTTQRSVEGILALTNGSLEERIAYWIAALTQRDGVDIVMQCRQRDLYSLFGVQRSSLIAALDRLKEDGYIDYTPTEISVKSRSRLLGILSGEEDDA
ncbi:MAG: Crp/Fnr family transcriptional regulator [Muribaculaceae bacterium]|nr:Crp/Fnr family transcriptional regulator [Muribaculaceae bacterium]